MIKSILFPKVHRGLNIITWATSVRYLGWGLVDGIMSLYLFSFADSYTGTGILQSIYSVVFIFAVPIVGAIANKVRSKNLILSGLVIYPFIGLSYYLAGLWGVVFFIFVARFLNGISFALDNVGRATYLRKHQEKKAAGSAFGYMISLTNFWWLVAVLAGAVVVNYTEMHNMFLFIIPTSLIAFVMIARVPKDDKDNVGGEWKKYVSLSTYKDFLQEIILWNFRLKKIAFLLFFLGIATYSVSFFMPIILFTNGDSIQNIILFVFISNVPAVFSSTLGWLADRAKPIHLTIAFFVLGVFLLALGFANLYIVQLFIMFLFMTVSFFISLFIDAEMTRRGDDRKYGTLSSAVMEVGEFSSMLAPIFIGFLIDVYNTQIAFVLLAVLIMAVTVFSRPVHKELILH